MGNDACYEMLRQIRWAEDLYCPRCESKQVIKDGWNEVHPDRQNYKCKSCKRDFDDLTGTIFSGSQKDLKTWILCMYLMGLNLSNTQIAKELDLPQKTAQSMTEQLREGIAKKNLLYNLAEKLRPTRSI